MFWRPIFTRTIASGARALAEATGAELCLSAYDEGETFDCAFAHRELHDGDELTLGKIKLRTLHTPGHTPEHISFLLSEPRAQRAPTGPVQRRLPLHRFGGPS